MTLTKKEKIVYAAIAASVFLVLLTFMILVLVYFPYKFKKGDGSQTNPYLIETFEDLSGLSKNVGNSINYSGKFFRLNNDIVFPDDIEWEPIGTKSNPFKGVFDGNNHKISNLNFTKSSDDFGLFGYVENLNTEYVVKNLEIQIGHVSVENDFSNFGCLAGNIVGNIYNIKTGGNIITSADFDCVSLIVGFLKGNAYDCVTEGAIDLTVSSGEDGCVGGAFGKVDGNIYNCISGVHIVEKSLHTEPIHVDLFTGGLVGFIKGENRKIDNCISSLFIKSIGNTGGLICGFENGLTISNCKKLDVLENISLGNVYVGGIIAFCLTPVKILNCESDTTINVTSTTTNKEDYLVYVGGIMGYGEGEIKNCAHTEVINVFSDMSTIVGGIVGRFKGDIECSYATSNIKIISKYSYVCIGGLVGDLTGDNSVIMSNYYYGVISYIAKSIQTVVNFADNVGFIVGRFLGQELTINSNYYSFENYDLVQDFYKKPELLIGFYDKNVSVINSLYNNNPISLETLCSGECINGLNRYISEEDLLINNKNVWKYSEGWLPILYYQEMEE